uniref:Putative head-tail joining protein n=1 Tax=viral metagenome TaxID=1070528 RepID=A0A6M3L1W7_9ZZZZ
MTWLASKLNHRAILQRAIQVPADDGGVDYTFVDLSSIWASVKPLQPFMYLAGRQANIATPGMYKVDMTHEVLIRRVSVDTLGREFTPAFDVAFDEMADLMNPKSDLYVFVPQGTSTTTGRRFKVGRIEDVGERREYMRLWVEELEEEGTGWPGR